MCWNQQYDIMMTPEAQDRSPTVKGVLHPGPTDHRVCCASELWRHSTGARGLVIPEFDVPATSGRAGKAQVRPRRLRRGNFASKVKRLSRKRKRLSRLGKGQGSLPFILEHEL